MLLDGIDTIDWKSLSHAYGDASDVPDLLRDLLSNDATARESAAKELFTNIWHQGTVYSATVHALPFLIDVLESDETPDQESVALLVASIMDGHGYCEVHFAKPRINPFTRKPMEPPPDLDERLAAEANYVAQIHDVGARAVEALIPYLKHEEPDFRADVARALAHQMSKANLIVPALTAACASESNENTRVAMRNALDALNLGTTDARDSLERSTRSWRS